MDVHLPGTPTPPENETHQSQVSLKSQLGSTGSQNINNHGEIILPERLQRSEQFTSLSFQRTRLEFRPPSTTKQTTKLGSAMAIRSPITSSDPDNFDLQEVRVENSIPTTSNPAGSAVDIKESRTSLQSSFDKQARETDSRSTKSTSSASSLSRLSLSSCSTKSSLGSIDGRLSFVASVTHLQHEDTGAYKLLSLDNFENKNKKFICVSCNNILRFPVQLSQCEHNVCSTCLSDLDKGYAKCPVDGKKFIRKEVKVNRELTEKLNKQLISCPMTDVGCNWKGVFKEYEEHFKVCECKQEVCPNGCGLMITKKTLKVHADRECTKRHVMCRFCVRAVKAEVEIEHIKICPRFPLTCPKDCGDKELPREEMKDHLEEKCRFRLEQCPYNNLGCKFSGMGEDIQLHMMNGSNQHPTMIRDKLSNVLVLMEKHSQLIQQHEETLQDQTKKLKVLNRIYGSQMLWKIDEWAKRRSDAISGKKAVLRSPPFYTGKYEYKLALSLLPNGDGTAKSRYMSIYIAVCKGAYDSLLKWPFRMTAALSLVDQCQDPMARKDHTYTIKPNPCDENAPFLARPKNGPNLSFGAQKFILCEALSTRDYVRDDVIYIRVRVEEEDM